LSEIPTDLAGPHDHDMHGVSMARRATASERAAADAATAAAEAEAEARKAGRRVVGKPPT